MGSNEEHLSTHLQSDLNGFLMWGWLRPLLVGCLMCVLFSVKYKVNMNSFVFNSVNTEFTLLFLSFTAGEGWTSFSDLK